MAKTMKEEPLNTPDESLLSDALSEPLESSGNAQIEDDPTDTPSEQEYASPNDFNGNLAELLKEDVLTSIAEQLYEGVTQDLDSRASWEQDVSASFKSLGFSLNDSTAFSFPESCKAYDTCLAQALLRFYSLSQPELFPAEGPVQIQILGESHEQMDDQAERIRQYLNWHLTQEDRGYLPDSYRLLMYVGLNGCAFRKVTQDPVTHYPVSRLIKPQDFIVNNECVDVLSSTRLTHVLHLDEQTLKLRQKNTFYRAMDVSFTVPQEDEDVIQNDLDDSIQESDGIESTQETDKISLLTVWESHVQLVIEQDKEGKEDKDLPKPYIVTMIPGTRQILSLRRNWKQEDLDYRRKECFVGYTLIPGFGLYGIGYGKLLGGNAASLTSILRQLVNKGILSNFPGGLRDSAMVIPENDLLIGPGEFQAVDLAPNKNLKESLIPLPYGEPSVVLKDLYGILQQQTKELSATVELSVADQGANTPVGTTLAHLDVAHRLQSSVLRSLRRGLADELTLLYNVFCESFGDKTIVFPQKGTWGSVRREDFSPLFRLEPVSDPFLATSTQRIAHVQELLRLSSQAPQLYDLKVVHRRACKALQIENIDEILPPQQEALPLDPVTENMNALQGKPLNVALWQDHQAHLMVHQQFLEMNPDVAPTLQAHIATHRAYAYLIQMEQQTGLRFPSPEEMTNPQIQNEIALACAQAASQQQQAHQAQQAPDQNSVLLAEVDAQREGHRMKLEEAKIRADTEKYKTDIQAQTDAQKRQTEEEIARHKDETSLTVEAMKHSTQQEGDPYGQ